MQDEISIPDMPSININNSPGAIIATGDNNHQGNTSNNSVNNSNNSTSHNASEEKKKPTWLKWVCSIFIGICVAWLLISLFVKYKETSSFESIQLDWKEFVSLGGILIGLLARLF